MPTPRSSRMALPLIMSVYLGIAETAAQRARERCSASTDPVTPYLIGEMSGNHNQSLDRALEIVSAAAESGEAEES